MLQRRLSAVCATVVLVGAASGAHAAATPLGPVPIEDVPEDAAVALRSPESKAGGAIETGRSSTPVAPGLRLDRFESFDVDGWIRGSALAADLAGGELRPRYLSPDVAARRTPLSDQAARKNAVGGVNGDFFDIKATGAPLGAGMDGGKLLNAPGGGHNEVAAVGNHAGRMMQLFLDAAVNRVGAPEIRVQGLNTPRITPNQVALYTPFWGGAPRDTAVRGARTVTEVEVVRGVVTRVDDAPAPGPVPEGAVRLLGTESGADALRSMRIGERVGVHYRPRTDAGVQAAVGGNKVLLRDGKVDQVDDTELNPRTAVGFSADGRRMWLVVVDGRQESSRGMTELELAERLRSLGADDAINLDGGGSATLVARESGEQAATVHNSPSDGAERPVPNGFGFSTRPGSGRLRGFTVGPEVGGKDSARVLAGLSRRIRARGHDEVGAPAAGTPQWTVGSGGSVRQGVFRSARPGPVQVSARRGASRGTTGLTVLGPLARLDTDRDDVPLGRRGAVGRFRVLGFDREGFRTWVEPSDVRLRYDPRLLRITPERDGFRVEALTDSSASVVTAEVAGQRTSLGVGVARPAPVTHDPEVPDASVVRDGALAPRAGSSRVAVVSGAGLVAGSSHGPEVAGARRSLREALAAHPNLVVLNGDFVAHGTPADLGLAHRVLDAELGGRVPWVYVPGEQERPVSGTGDAFAAEFGRPFGVRDSGRTRCVFLDSSKGSLRSGGFEQVRMLRRVLDDAARDRSVDSVAVFTNRPIGPASPRSASLSDQGESELVTDWLAGFERVSGKNAVAVGAHTGAFQSSSVDGVRFEVNGDAAVRSPGGRFAGTSVLRMASGERGVRWETRPFVDRLRMSAPPRLAVGAEGAVDAQLVQGDRSVAVDYPVSASWSGRGVRIGRPENAGPDAVAVFDPRARRIIGLRPGIGSLSVTVNGVKETERIVITE